MFKNVKNMALSAKKWLSQPKRLPTPELAKGSPPYVEPTGPFPKILLLAKLEAVVGR